MTTPTEFGKQIGTIVRGLIAKAIDEVMGQIATLANRVKALEDRPMPQDGKDGAPGKDGEPGKDGADATNEQLHVVLANSNDLLQAAVASHLNANPIPAGPPGNDGVDGTSPSPEDVSHILVADAAFKSLVGEHIQTFITSNPPAAGKDGAPGQDGVSPDPVDIGDALMGHEGFKQLLVENVQNYFEENPPAPGQDGQRGEDGAPGAPGQDAPAPTADVVLEALRADPDMLAGAIARHMADNPVPAGQDGAPGQDGADAPPPTADTVAAALAAQPALLASAVSAWLSEHPPAPGKDADPEVVRQITKEFMDANPAPAGRNGEPGRDGKDGTSVTLDDVAIQLASMHAQWALDFERRAMDVLHRTLDKFVQPANGKDGADGLGFDDLSVNFDGERTIKFMFVRGDQSKEFSLKLSHPIHRGIFKKDALYEVGDAVTWGGSAWLAKKDTNAQPGTNTDWQLIVKRGQDGKDGKDSVAKGGR
jgi:integrin beta 3